MLKYNQMLWSPELHRFRVKQLVQSPHNNTELFVPKASSEVSEFHQCTYTRPFVDVYSLKKSTLNSRHSTLVLHVSTFFSKCIMKNLHPLTVVPSCRAQSSSIRKRWAVWA